MSKIAIVGAGLSGLYLGKLLQSDGHHVALFEKSRGPGGRLCGRRLDVGQHDMGAPYLSDRPGHPLLQELQSAGVIMPWMPRLARIEPFGLGPIPNHHTRWVGVPYHNAISRYLATGLCMIPSTRIVGIQPTDTGWQLNTLEGAYPELFEWVFLANPPEQSHALSCDFLPPPTIQMGPTFTVLLCSELGPDMGVDMAWGESVIGTMIDTTSKPQRRTDLKLWTLHASDVWSKANVDAPLEWVADQLTQSFLSVTKRNWTIIDTQVHRWLYATMGEATDSVYLDRSLRLGRLGDWTVRGDSWGAIESAIQIKEQFDYAG